MHVMIFCLTDGGGQPKETRIYSLNPFLIAENNIKIKYY